ncbi:MAG: hypothetical protein MUO38_04690, partial [Anaerolineales bacterium]|nr:hypothetical protein [Anaerolineales bacterium]
MPWQPRAPELLIPFAPREDLLYRLAHATSRYSTVRWPRAVGRSKHGEFPLVVVRQHFRRLGYTVWASEPELPDGSGFILVSFPGKRRAHHPAYARMEAIFGNGTLAELNRIADRKKRLHTGNASGGDPDLFVFRGADRFFVEVKWRDHITAKQTATFPLIERLCNVEI